MKEEEKRKIAEIMEKYGVAAGYLFGSAARGNAGPHSDIDVAVIFDKSASIEKQDEEKETLRDEISRAVRREQVDVINLSTATDPLIKYVAVFSGELIFEKNKRERFALERKIVRDYENTRELRRIARTVMKKQLADGSFGRSFQTA